jgi:predicted exporter
MNSPIHLLRRPWTRVEVAIWLLALTTILTIGILLVTNVVGSWAVLFGSGIVVAVGLMRYRAETTQAKRSADDHGE